MPRLLLISLTAAALVSCGGSAPASEPAAPATSDAIVAYHDSRAWAADTTRAVARAQRFLERHAGEHRSALVLDVDDTALSSYDCLHAAGFERAALTRCAEDATLTPITQTRAL